MVSTFIRTAAFALASTAVLPLASTASALPQFEDQTGKTFSLGSLGNTPIVLTFVSAHCVDTCPIINAQFEAMQQHVRQSRIPLRLVTLTLDPAHDSRQDMLRIARTFEADARYWVIGSASVSTTKTLMHEFGVTSSRGKRDYDDIHTTFVYLLDKHGHLVKTMLASTNLSGDLFAELQRNWNKLDG